MNYEDCVQNIPVHEVVKTQHNVASGFKLLKLAFNLKAAFLEALTDVCHRFVWQTSVRTSTNIGHRFVWQTSVRTLAKLYFLFVTSDKLYSNSDQNTRAK